MRAMTAQKRQFPTPIARPMEQPRAHRLASTPENPTTNQRWKIRKLPARIRSLLRLPTRVWLSLREISPLFLMAVVALRRLQIPPLVRPLRRSVPAFFALIGTLDAIGVWRFTMDLRTCRRFHSQS